MRKFLLVIACLLIFIGCDAAEKETWKVINVNCPTILAEKSGKTKTFVYDEPYGEHNSMFPTTAFAYNQCLKKVRVGWIIEVDNKGKAAFFPPTSAEANCSTQ